MNKVDGRIFLTADELERIARCPRSIGHLDRIEAAVECPHCRALADLGKELLKRAFRNAVRPHTAALLEELEQAYVRRDDVYDPSPKDAAMVNDLATWCFGVGERVNMVDVPAETHFGMFTVTDTIDAVIYDVDEFAVVRFLCGRPHASSHAERVMNYRSLHARLWTEEKYEIDSSTCLVVRPSGSMIRLERFDNAVPAHILRASIEHILSSVFIPDRDERAYAAKASQLPAIYGDHCWSCMACFR